MTQRSCNSNLPKSFFWKSAVIPIFRIWSRGAFSVEKHWICCRNLSRIRWSPFHAFASMNKTHDWNCGTCESCELWHFVCEWYCSGNCNALFYRELTEEVENKQEEETTEELWCNCVSLMEFSLEITFNINESEFLSRCKFSTFSFVLGSNIYILCVIVWRINNDYVATFCLLLSSSLIDFQPSRVQCAHGVQSANKSQDLFRFHGIV